MSKKTEIQIPAQAKTAYLANTTIVLPDGASLYADQVLPDGVLGDERIAELIAANELREAETK